MNFQSVVCHKQLHVCLSIYAEGSFLLPVCRTQNINRITSNQIRNNCLRHVIIKFPYNVHSDWLKQRALSENRERVDDGKLAFKFLLRNFDKFDPN